MKIKSFSVLSLEQTPQMKYKPYFSPRASQILYEPYRFYERHKKVFFFWKTTMLTVFYDTISKHFTCSLNLQQKSLLAFVFIRQIFLVLPYNQRYCDLPKSLSPTFKIGIILKNAEAKTQRLSTLVTMLGTQEFSHSEISSALL